MTIQEKLKRRKEQLDKAYQDYCDAVAAINAEVGQLPIPCLCDGKPGAIVGYGPDYGAHNGDILFGPQKKNGGYSQNARHFPRFSVERFTDREPSTPSTNV